jgi:16S rRNA (uracil1498-N3)-methyltransferase
MHRFYCPDLSKETLLLPEEEAHHCARVLRAAIGDHVVLLDGKGQKAIASIQALSKKEVEVLILERQNYPHPPFQLHLAMAPPKSRDRLEWFVEKAVECGLTALSFIQTEHSERVKINKDRLEKIAIAAMKQCGNPWKCNLYLEPDFQGFLWQHARGTIQRWIAHVHPEHPHFFNQIIPSQDGLLLIGPEGDFSDQEISLAIALGYQPVSFGQLVLRTETAGLFGVNAFFLKQLSP